MGRTRALEHEVERLRRMVERREAKIQRIYAKLHDSKIKADAFEKLRLAVREQSDYIAALKDEVERLGGDWRGLYDGKGRMERRRSRTASGEPRK